MGETEMAPQTVNVSPVTQRTAGPLLPVNAVGTQQPMAGDGEGAVSGQPATAQALPAHASVAFPP